MITISSPTANPSIASFAHPYTSSHASGAPSSPCFGASARVLIVDDSTPTGRKTTVAPDAGRAARFLFATSRVLRAPAGRAPDPRERDFPALFIPGSGWLGLRANGIVGDCSCNKAGWISSETRRRRYSGEYTSDGSESVRDSSSVRRLRCCRAPAEAG